MSRPPLASPAAALVLAVLSLAPAAPALADGMSAPARYGDHRPRAPQVHRAGPRHGHRLAPAPGHLAFAPPAGPLYHAWPEPAEVRVPIYNRPSHRPPSW